MGNEQEVLHDVLNFKKEENQETSDQLEIFLALSQ